jgi:hypothetical protein
MANFREEAIELAKQVIFCWNDHKDFEAVVSILEDYIVDQDSKHLENKS